MWIVQQLKNTCKQIKNTYIKLKVLVRSYFSFPFFFFTNADNVQPYLKSKVLKVKVA